MRFAEKLQNIVHMNNSLLCVGLDIDSEKMPAYLFETSKQPYLDFNKSVIDATKDLVCSYKLNMAFYEVFGKKGIELLEKTIRCIPKDVIIILDGKRNDIGNTAEKYAQSLFDVLHADAVTTNPYLGKDGVMPFLEYKDKCTFILCRTSNPSAKELQGLLVSNSPLYQKVAEKIKEWNIYGTAGAVVGATYPQELQIVRKIIGDDIPLLIPGVGRQGGDVEQTIKNGTTKKGEGAIINSSREIIFAGSNEHFAETARTKAMALKNEINKYRTQ